MSQLIISNAKVLKGDKIKVEYKKKDSSEAKPAKCSEEHSTPPHKDLKKAFSMLAIHAALLGEFVPLSTVPDILKVDPELTKNFNVSGFSVVGEDDDNGVILTAQKILKTGKYMGFNTPTIRFGDDGENAYPYLDELELAVADCKDEMIKYLNGKFGDEPQQKLELK